MPKPQVGLVGQLGWCIVEGSAHQQKVLTYFNETEERRQQFVVVEVEGWGDENVTLPLRWVTRSDLNQLTTPTLLTSEGQLKRVLEHPQHGSAFGGDYERDGHLHALPKKRGLAHANARAGGHPEESEKNVNRVLRKVARCPEGMWQDVLYAKCAGAILQGGFRHRTSSPS